MTTDLLIQHCTNALLAAHERVVSLGKEGIVPVQHNQHGDHALAGDIAAEEAVLQYFQAHQLPIRVLSEEHGITDITDAPTYLVLLDGIDGSIRYERYHEGDTDGRFGTLLTLYASLDPSYSDYLFAGSYEHPTRTLYWASKEGAYMTKGSDTTPLHTAEHHSFTPETPFYIDSNPAAAHVQLINEIFATPFASYAGSCYLSSAVHYADLASGTVDAVLECTRKGNLEIAYGYSITTSAGGVMLDMQGADIGARKVLEFGMREHIPLVAACQYSLAKECVNASIAARG